MPVLAGGRGFGGNGRFAIALGANAWAPSATAALPVLAELGRFSTAAPPLALAGEAEYRDISRSLPTLVGGATAALADRCPPLRPALRGQDDDQLDHLRDEFAFLLRTIAAAVLVNAAEVIGEYLDWLARIFAARGRSHRLLPLTVEAAVLALEPFPRARGLLAGAAGAR
jgi:hypothetical protein